MYCSNCGIELAKGASFCSDCGEKTIQHAPTEQNQIGQGTVMQGQPKKKRKGLGCLVIVLLVIAIIVTISNMASPNTESGAGSKEGKEVVSPEDLKSQGLKFDERSWGEFLTLYKTHNDLMKAIDSYSNGNVSKLDFYDYCKELEKWFANASISFNYAKTDDEKTYLSTYATFALADQAAIKSLIKYLDSNATKDLSAAKESIERANQAATTISGNRVVFLRKLGLSKEELDTKINEAVADVSALESK